MSACSVKFNPIMTLFITLSITFSITFFASIAKAQHSDIWLILDESQVAIDEINTETNTPTTVDQTTGRFLFSSNFSDLGQGPQGTDDPGFQTLANTFTPNGILNFRAIESLLFWNGDAWVNSVVDQERILVIDALSNSTIIDVAGISNAEGAIDQIDSGGSIHQHIEFYVDNHTSENEPAPGAYMINMEFFATDTLGGNEIHATSEPVRITFAYLISPEEYEEAVSALTSPITTPEEISVPIPNGALLVLAGLLFVFARRKPISRKIIS